MNAPESQYLIALGSNQRHPRWGGPRAILVRALQLLANTGCGIVAASPIITTRPVGPSQRSYANSAAIITGQLTPHAMLSLLQSTEKMLDRDRRGQRWRARTLDLDIILWSGGKVAGSSLTVPHPRFRERSFVLAPAVTIAPDWCDPVTKLTLRQLKARLTRPRALLR